MTEPYAELHAASAFSFLAGASVPENLVARAAELGLPAIALLDRNGVYGAPRFHTKALAIAKGGGPTVRTHFGSENQCAGGRRGAPAPAVRHARGLPQPVPDGDAHEAARAGQGGGLRPAA